MRVFRLLGAIAAIAVATVLVVGACSAQPKPPPELTAPEIAAKSSEAMQKVKSFHFDLEAQGGEMSFGQGITLSKAQGETVVPDKAQVQFTGAFAGFQMESQLVSVGSKQYLQNPLTKKWQPLGGSFDASALFRPEGGAPSLIAKAQNLEKVSKETIDGVECYHLRGTLSAKDLASIGADPNGNASVTADAWMGTQDFLVRQLTLKGTIAAGEPADLTRVIHLSRFDQTFDIRPPE